MKTWGLGGAGGWEFCTLFSTPQNVGATLTRYARTDGDETNTASVFGLAGTKNR